jgi:hypothetical protein
LTTLVAAISIGRMVVGRYGACLAHAREKPHLGRWHRGRKWS